MKLDLYLYNSLTRKKEKFLPINPPNVGMYSCGFTVYDHTHIGHIKKYVGDDVLLRVLKFNGYKIRYVQNVTDVGHLASDADAGEDKMEKGAKKHGLSVIEIARKFEKEFYDSLDKVNVLRPDVIQRAADDKSIHEQIKFIQTLVDKGFAYIKSRAIYFDVSKLSDYNPFSNQPLEDKLVGSREDVEIDPEKRSPSDFVLWMFRKGKYANHVMHWDSPWGDGFPGWHIECSAIGMCNLGDRFDIHTGGIDHLLIHHPNEIAQNYGVTGHKVVNFWVHHNFLIVNGKKMSKSLNNYYTVYDVMSRGYDPLALRYFVLGTHYRKIINFTWDVLDNAQNALDKLCGAVRELVVDSSGDSGRSFIENFSGNSYYHKFLSSINDDLNMPKALAVVWELVKDDKVEAKIKLTLIKEFDKVLGLKLFDRLHLKRGKEISFEKLPVEIRGMVNKREQFRKEKKWKEADEIREILKDKGYNIKDYSDKTCVSKIN